MSRYQSVADFAYACRLAIQSEQYETALTSIHDFVEQIIVEPLNISQTFGSRLLDDLCQDIGGRLLERLGSGTRIEASNGVHDRGSCPTNVYIASRLYKNGGHTLALADIIRLGPRVRSIVLLTGVAGPTDVSAVMRHFDGTPDVTVEHAPRGRYVARLTWVQHRLAALAPQHVWLFNHHQDSVAVAAVQPNRVYRLRFYHHGDHRFSLGVFLRYGDHFDMHSMGFHNCRSELRISTNRYLPLTVPDRGLRQHVAGNGGAAGLVTCTSGNSNKVEAPYWIRYVDVVPKILQISGGRHIHFGHLTHRAKARLRRNMKRIGVPNAAFVHVPYVKSLWEALQHHEVDLYIASFPYGGARTLIEAMGAGIPVVLHSHHSSRLLGTHDMAYDEAFIWRDPEDLYAYLRTLSRAELLRHASMARMHYDRYYREDLVAHALRKTDDSLEAPPLRSDFASDDLQQALDWSGQVSCRGVAWRLWKRALNRLNSIRA